LIINQKKNTFFKDLEGGLLVLGIFILNAILLKIVFSLEFLYIIFSIGIEIILLFTIKGFLNKNEGQAIQFLLYLIVNSILQF